MPFQPSKYRPFQPVSLSDRTWPSRVITLAPRWCSVDLRDGNQALVEPMGYARKRELFELLVRIGMKEIEVGFPAASQTDFDFVRRLIDEDRIPRDVTIQVLVQARQDLIQRTFDAVRGARRVIVHLYNSTSELQRRVVFGKDRAAVRELALQGTRWVKEQAATLEGTEVVLEYSPESFTGTELDFAVEVCDAVAATWEADSAHPMIVNLPATVEMATPNVYADQIEWMIRNLKYRSACIVSLHTHNDRGTAVAATELAVLAGAERVEGTLFGNGERTGNVDLVTLAMNLYSQGIDPNMDLSDLPEVARVYERCCRMPIHPRHPYVGELVFTAFSGSHQDAIKKGLSAMARDGSPSWEVPYLPIDPADVGRAYEPLVRINSQSGKGGIAFVLERAAGYRIPKELAKAFSQSIQSVTDQTGSELSASDLVERFEREFLDGGGAFEIRTFEVERRSSLECQIRGKVARGADEREFVGNGNGPIDAFVQAINRVFDTNAHCLDYAEHALGQGEDAEAVAYVHLRHGERTAWGVGRAPDIVAASLRAVGSALARLPGFQTLQTRREVTAAGARASLNLENAS